MTDEEQDQISQAKNEAEQAKADREGLLKEIEDLRHKVRVHQSAAGVQQRHAEDYRDKLQKARKDRERVMPILRSLADLDGKKFDPETAQKLIAELVKEMNG